MNNLAGYCPMGCGATLFHAAGGHITCAHIRCPRPTAVDELLDDRETEHVVQIGETAFVVRHPLRERLDGALIQECTLHEYLRSRSGPPAQPGRYRVTWRGDPAAPWQLLP